MIRSITERLLNPFIERYANWRASRESRYEELSELDRLHAGCLRVISTYGTQTEVNGRFHYQFVLPDQGLYITVSSIDNEHLNPGLQYERLNIQQTRIEANGDQVTTTSLVDPYNERIHSYHEASAQSEYHYNGGPEFPETHLEEATQHYHRFLAESVVPTLGAYEAQIAAMAYPVSPYQ